MKGQFYRLVLAADSLQTQKVIAASKELTLHLSAQTEESSTKDTTGSALEYEVTGQSYEISGSALVLSDDDTLLTGATKLDDFLSADSDTLLYWSIYIVEGTNNRTLATKLLSGTAKLTQLQMNGQNRQNATYSYTLKGVGAVKVEYSPESSSAI